MAESKIIWKCSICGQPIADGAGYVECDAWGQAETPFDGWRALHRGCDPDVGGSTYWVAISRLRTQTDLSRTTEHLSSKPWWDANEWQALLDVAVCSRVQSATLTHSDPQSQGG